jgi:hypothetical protein
MLECGGVVEKMRTGAQDGKAEAVVTLDQRDSGVVRTLFGVPWDEAVAIDDDVSAGNDGSDGTVLRTGMGRKTYGEEDCHASPEVSDKSRVRATRMGPDLRNDGITSRLISTSARRGEAGA